MGQYFIYNGELYHHGIKGMKWGVRRYQNEDGSLTPAGKKRQAKLQSKWEKKVERDYYDAYVKATREFSPKISDINAKYKNVNFRNDRKTYRKYVEEYVNMWNSTYEKHLVSTLGEPVINDGRKWCDRVMGFMDAEEEIQDMIREWDGE